LTWSQIVVIGLVVVGACVRSSLTTAFHAWSSGVLEAVSVAIVLLAPLILPAVMQFAESCGTAHVLAYLEAAVIRARWKLKLEVRQ
jgi:spore maturation protein SpmA